jgi:trigger factor
LKVNTETVATREVVLTIEPDADTIQEAMRRTARQISRLRPVPGFRPGRAPYAMVERVFGREVILNQALDDMAPDLYRQALEQAEIEAYSQGQIEVESEDPVVLKLNVSLTPTVELGDYSELSIEPEPEVAITEEQIEEEIEAVRRSHAEYTPVERPLQMGDHAVLDIKGVSGDEEIVNRERVTVNVTDEMMPPGFGEALVGMSAGESREFTLAYPDDFEDEELAGREVDYEVTLHTVREAELPDVDDDLAKMAGDFDTLDELREALTERLTQRLEAEQRQREAEAAIEALLGVATIEYPQAALEDEVDRIVQNQAERLQSMGLNFQSYLNMIGQTIETFRDNVRPSAKQSLTERLALLEYAQAEEIKIGDAELQNEIGRVLGNRLTLQGSSQVDEALEQMRTDGTMRLIYSDAMVRKGAQHLVAKFTGREEELAELSALADSEAAEDEALSEDAEAADEGTSAPAVDESAAPADEGQPEADIEA